MPYFKISKNLLSPVLVFALANLKCKLNIRPTAPSDYQQVWVNVRLSVAIMNGSYQDTFIVQVICNDISMEGWMSGISANLIFASGFECTLIQSEHYQE